MGKADIVYHKECLEAIRWLARRKWGEIVKKNSPLHGRKIMLAAEGKKFAIKFILPIGTESFEKVGAGKTIKNLLFNPTSPRHSLVLEDSYIHTYSPPRHDGFIHSLRTKRFSSKKLGYFKLFVPLSKALNFFHQIEPAHFISDTGTISMHSVTAVISGVSLLACIIKDQVSGQFFLSIESKHKLTFSSFKNKAHAIRNGLAYLTGHLSGNQAYYFSYTNHSLKLIKSFHYTEIRSEIKSGYTPVNSNPYSWIRKRKSEADKLYIKRSLRNISRIEFSTLCQRLHDDIEFTKVILLIIESSVASLTFMPGGFAIALEMLADIITAGNNPNLKPVPDKNLQKKIVDDLQQIVERYKSEIGEDAARIFNNKIRNLNQVTNDARLKAPFEALQLPLEEEDQKVIRTRNKFLHGKVPDILSVGTNRRPDRVNSDLYYASMRLYTLLNMLILKWIGFDNYVLNYPKIQEEACQMKIKEKFYRKI